MARTKIVNGRRVTFTAEEEARRDAEEAAAAEAPPPVPKLDPLAELLIDKGVITREEIDAKRGSPAD